MKFLRFPEYYEDESLLSYLLRFSHVNSCSLSWILTEFKLYFYSLESINRTNNYEYIKKISSITKLTPEQIKNLTFYRYDKNHFFYTKQKNDDQANEKYEEDYGIFKKKFSPFYNKSQEPFHKKYSMLFGKTKYCPICLEESSYHRLYWNISPVKICIKHKVKLVGICDSCGKSITIEEVINGKCRCDKSFKECKVIKCTDENLNRLQEDLYKNLGVNCKEKYNCCETKIDLKFVSSIYQLFVKLYNQKDQLILIRNYLNKEKSYDEDLFILLIVQKLRANSNETLEILLNDLNVFMNLEFSNMSNDIVLENKYTGNPISVLRLIINELEYVICNKDILYDFIFQYFKKHYTFSFFRLRLNKILINERYINIPHAAQIFQMTWKTLQSTLTLYQAEENVIKYIDLEEIISLIQTYINNCNYNSNKNEEYITIEDAHSIFHKLAITELEIMNILKANKIKMRIDPFMQNSGMNIIEISKKELFRLLLEDALKKL